MTIKNILLVEDNPDDGELMKLAFARSEIPHNLIILSDGIEALNYLQRASYNELSRSGDRSMAAMPAVVILDINLPTIDGIEVLRRIRADSRTTIIPVVIISSSNEPQDLIDSYLNGCNSYIRKPLDFTQLKTLLKR